MPDLRARSYRLMFLLSPGAQSPPASSDTASGTPSETLKALLRPLSESLDGRTPSSQTAGREPLSTQLSPLRAHEVPEDPT